MFDMDPIGKITEYSQCPEIDICLNGKIVTSLIDTGSEVTAISEKFYNKNLEYFKACPTFQLCPLKFSKAATGNKSTRLKSQVMIPTKIFSHLLLTIRKDHNIEFSNISI